MAISNRICSVENCDKPFLAQYRCRYHYYQAKAQGKIQPIYRPHGLKKKFFETYILVETHDCINWPFDCGKRGHGRIFIDGKWFFVHRIVCQNHYGDPPTSKHQAAHNCGNSKCFNYHHIRWATPKENYADRIIHGTTIEGEKHPQSILVENEVLSILSRINLGERHCNLAKEFNVDPTTISDIWRRKTWRHLEV